MNRIAWRFKSELVATALVVALAGVGFVNAQDSASTTLTGQDYEEIKALYARYNQGSDFRDAELFLSAFAKDAVMTRGGRDIVGMDALRADRAERYQGKTGDVKAFWPELADVVQWIVQAGGAAVIAHPLKYRFTRIVN